MAENKWQVIYTEESLEDMQAIAKFDARNIFRSINKKLGSDPEIFGQPLRGKLRGIWRLRVGDYRVIFHFVGRTVNVLAVLHRSVVYKEIEKRL